MDRKEAIEIGEKIRKHTGMYPEYFKALQTLLSNAKLVEDVVGLLESEIKYGKWNKSFIEGLEYALTLLTEGE